VGTRTELRVLVFRDGEAPTEWMQGPYEADTDAAVIVPLDLTRVVGSSLAAVSVVANAYAPDGQKLGSHGVEGYAYADAGGRVTILTEAEATARVTTLAPASEAGYTEIAELLGREVTP
jgi:hypothetical protein